MCRPTSCIPHIGMLHPRGLPRSNRTMNHRSSLSLRFLVAALLGLSHLPRSNTCFACSTPKVDCTLPHHPHKETPQFGQETSEQQNTHQNPFAAREELIYSCLDALIFLAFHGLLSSASSIRAMGEQITRNRSPVGSWILMHQNVSINGVVNAMRMLRKTQPQ